MLIWTTFETQKPSLCLLNSMASNPSRLVGLLVSNDAQGGVVGCDGVGVEGYCEESHGAGSDSQS